MHAAPRRINRAVSGILVPSEDSGGFSGGLRRALDTVRRHCLSQHACRSGACAVDELHTIISILHIDLQPFLVLNSELCVSCSVVAQTKRLQHTCRAHTAPA